MTRLIWGITPEHWTLRVNTSPYAPSETTPSWIRAPPESLIPITGQPILAARSMILHIFSAITSPSEPPNTVKSWLNTHTRRPSIVPWPGDDRVAVGPVLLHVELVRAVAHEHVELLERTGVEQLLDALPRGVLAALVLLGDGLLRAGVDRLVAQLLESSELLVVGLGSFLAHRGRRV